MKNLRSRPKLLVAASLSGALILGAGNALLGVCGPFTDVAADAFCPFVLEVFYLGITTGTTPTTYDPSASVSRLQMAAFLSRSVDGVLKRGSRRAALNQFWTPANIYAMGVTILSGSPQSVASDGLDLWVPAGANTFRVRASDGGIVGTWSGGGNGVALVATGHVFMTQNGNPGSLLQIDPSLPPGAAQTVASNLGQDPFGIAFDGSAIWTANAGSVSIVGAGGDPPWPATTVATGFVNPLGALFDGTNIWVTDKGAGTLLKLNATGAILQTVTVGAAPLLPIFDGNNIWVPNSTSNSVSVVRASTGAVLSTLTGNGLDHPQSAAFDGTRVVVANAAAGGGYLSVWKAADFTALGFHGTGVGTVPRGACSDGVNFWVVVGAQGPSRLLRF